MKKIIVTAAFFCAFATVDAQTERGTRSAPATQNQAPAEKINGDGTIKIDSPSDSPAPREEKRAAKQVPVETPQARPQRQENVQSESAISGGTSVPQITPAGTAQKKRPASQPKAAEPQKRGTQVSPSNEVRTPEPAPAKSTKKKQAKKKPATQPQVSPTGTQNNR